MSEIEKHKIAIGTYDKALYGFDLFRDEENQVALEPIFAYPSEHTGCIKTLAMNTHGTMVSGSTDESIRTYNLRAKKEVDSFPLNEGTINCVKTWRNLLCMTGSESGTIRVWETEGPGTLNSLRTLDGHNLGINSIAIHPTGKLAISSSKDMTLRVWNLSTGACRLVHQLDFEAEIVVWNTRGTHYAVSGFDSIKIFNLEGEKIRELDAPELKHILAMVFLTDNLLATGGEDRAITIWDIKTGKEVYLLEGFENRVKAIDIITENDNEEGLPLLVAISTDGTLKVWDLDDDTKDPAVEKILNGRLVCLATGSYTLLSKEERAKKRQKRSAAKKRKAGKADAGELQVEENIEQGAQKKRKIKPSDNVTQEQPKKKNNPQPQQPEQKQSEQTKPKKTKPNQEQAKRPDEKAIVKPVIPKIKKVKPQPTQEEPKSTVAPKQYKHIAKTRTENTSLKSKKPKKAPTSL